MTSAGPNSPGTTATVDRDGKQAWSPDPPDNVKLSNDSYANIDVNASDYTDWLRVTNFGFSIPADATINGILVEIEAYGEGGGGSAACRDDSCRLVLDGVVKGDEKSPDTVLSDSDPDAYRSYGGSSDNWNASLTYSDINNSLFGVQVSYYNTHGTQARNVYVDHVRITIYYTEAGAGEADKQSILKGVLKGVFGGA